jgi:hypothetical protein
MVVLETAVESRRGLAAVIEGGKQRRQYSGTIEGDGGGEIVDKFYNTPRSVDENGRRQSGGLAGG